MKKASLQYFFVKSNFLFEISLVRAMEEKGKKEQLWGKIRQMKLITFHFLFHSRSFLNFYEYSTSLMQKTLITFSQGRAGRAKKRNKKKSSKWIRYYPAVTPSTKLSALWSTTSAIKSAPTRRFTFNKAMIFFLQTKYKIEVALEYWLHYYLRRITINCQTNTIGVKITIYIFSSLWSPW